MYKSKKTRKCKEIRKKNKFSVFWNMTSIYWYRDRVSHDFAAPSFSDYPEDRVSKLLCIVGTYIPIHSIMQVLQFFCQYHSSNSPNSYFIHLPSTLHNPSNRERY